MRDSDSSRSRRAGVAANQTQFGSFNLLPRNLLSGGADGVIRVGGFQSGRVDKQAAAAVEVDFALQVVARCAGLVGDNGRRRVGLFIDQRVPKAAFTGVRQANENNAWQSVAGRSGLKPRSKPLDILPPQRQAVMKLASGNELDVLFHEVEARFQFGQRVEETLAEVAERAGQTARELFESNVEFPAAAGIDDAKDCFGLR
jgi:hypothetical protein